jgi:cell division protein FtsB
VTQIERRFYAALIVIIFGLFIIIGLGHYRAEQLMQDVLVPEKLMDTLAEKIEINIEQLKQLKNHPEDPHVREYARELRNMFEAVCDDYGLAGIYLITEDEDKRYYVYLLDSRLPDVPLTWEGRPHVLDTDVPGIIVEKAYRHAGKHKGEPLRTEGGARTGRFWPIGYGHNDESPDAVAVLGVEYETDTYNAFIYQTFYIQCGIVLIGAALIYLILRKFIKILSNK